LIVGRSVFDSLPENFRARVFNLRVQQEYNMEGIPVNKEAGRVSGGWQGCLSALGSLGIFLLIGAGLTIWGWNILQNARASASWPTAEGVVLSSEVSLSTDAEGSDSYSPEVTYRYLALDSSYENRTIKFGENSYGNRRKAQEIAARYPVGKSVTVYFDPDMPARSVLEPGVSAGSYIVLGIGLFFILIALVSTPISLFLRSK
jgi:hypothetical protein